MEVEYDADTPRCANCSSYLPKRTILINSLPRTAEPWCKLNKFNVRGGAVCNAWTGRDGSCLEV